MKPETNPAGRRRVVAGVTAVLAALLVWVGVVAVQASASSPTPTATNAPVTLRIGWVASPPDSMNPFLGINSTAYLIYHLNYDFLVGFDSRTMSPRPELATSWSLSPDNKTWTFYIRKGVTWQDGVPLTARDVAFTFNYIKSNDLTNDTYFTDPMSKIKVINDYELQITTKQPDAVLLTEDLVPIVPEHIWSKISGKAAGSTYANNPPVIGSGPFQVVSWGGGKTITLVANKHYWGGAPKVDRLIFETYTNPTTMVDDLQSGAVDGITGVPPAMFAPLTHTSGITTNLGTSWRFTELAFNCSTSPGSLGNPVCLDEKFRQALGWAINRPQIVEGAFHGYGSVGSTLLPPYSQYHWQPPASATVTYDPQRAKQLLDAAGYKVGADGFRTTKTGKPLTLRLFVATDSAEDQVAARMVSAMLANVGIKTKLSVMDSSALSAAQFNYKGKTFAPNWDLFLWYWTPYIEPDNILSNYLPAWVGSWNDCSWTNPQYTKLCQQEETTIGFAQRKPIIATMQQIFYNSSPYIILDYPYFLEAYNSNKWTGWVHAPSNMPGYSGAVIYDYCNIDTYRFVTLRSVSAAASSHGTAAIVVIVLVVVVVAGGAGYLVVRRRRKAQTEMD